MRFRLPERPSKTRRRLAMAHLKLHDLMRENIMLRSEVARLKGQLHTLKETHDGCPPFPL